MKIMVLSTMKVVEGQEWLKHIRMNKRVRSVGSGWFPSMRVRKEVGLRVWGQWGQWLWEEWIYGVVHFWIEGVSPSTNGSGNGFEGDFIPSKPSMLMFPNFKGISIPHL